MGQGFEILGWPDGLLQPIQIVGNALQCDIQRLVRGPGAVDVQHQQDVLAGGLTCYVHAFDVNLMQLDGFVALVTRLGDGFRYMLRRRITDQTGVGGDFRRRGTAKELVQGQAGALAGQVPQRDVHAADAKIGHPVTAEQVRVAEHPVLQRGDLGGVGTDEHGFEYFVHDRGGGLRHAVAERLAIPGQPRIGVHGNKHLVEIAPRPRHFLLAGRHGDGQHVGLHVGNLHCGLLWPGALTRNACERANVL